jgi:predicted RNA binding protein YcfA (HicA-like mRNA interferase family)
MANPFRLRSLKPSLKFQCESAACLFWLRCVKAFGTIGYAVDHQTGSHIILRHSSGRRLTVPNHRELAKATLRALIREADLTKKQVAELL